MAFRIKAYGTPPYSLNIKNYANVDIYNVSGLTSDDILVPDSVVNTLKTQSAIYTLSNAGGVVASRSIDNVTFNLKRKYYKGIAITNGEYSNHIDAINKSVSRGLTYVGVILNYGNVDDFDLNKLVSGGVFDHTVSSNSYAVPFDEVVRKAYLTDPTGVDNRVVLKVQIILTRDDNRLNNGTTRTLGWSEGDRMLLPDGSPVNASKNPNEVVSQVLVASYASPGLQAYADRLLQGFMRRYLAAINDGTILCIGIGNTRAAEGELESTITNSSGAVTGFTRGDFNPSMISAFKTAFPTYSSTDNNTISNSDLTSSDLGKRWYKFISNYIASFESTRIANAVAALPGISRTQWFLRDVGSYMDDQAGRRKTWNSGTWMHPKTMVVKCNDGPVNDNSVNRFILDELTSLARKCSAVPICEPTPPNHDFASEPNRSNTRNMIAIGVNEVGVGFSFIDSRDAALDFFLTDTALSGAPSIPKKKNDFKLIGGVLRSIGHTFPLSSIIANGSTYAGWKPSYESFKTSNEVTNAHTLPIDDIV